MITTAVKELNSAKQKRLGQIRDLEAQIQKINSALAALSGSAASAAPVAKAKGGYTRTPAQKAAMAKAQKASWAKRRAAQASTVVAAPVTKSAPIAKPAKKKFVMSPAHKAALKKAQAARWAKVKAAKKK